MLNIKAEQIGKKFQKDWIFRNLDLELNPNDSIVLLGSNGSGKSTLLQILIGALHVSTGEINYIPKNDTALAQEYWYKHVSVAAPYLDIYEELSLAECIHVQSQFKPFKKGLTTQQIIDTLELSHTKKKHISAFSSGMKQRVKLGLAILADSPILALDEPTMNLDKNAIAWFQNLLADNMSQRIVITCSNEQTAEYTHANKQLNLFDYKIKKK